MVCRSGRKCCELEQPETLQTRAKELLQQQKQPSLGVVLHLADQLDQGIVQEEFHKSGVV